MWLRRLQRSIRSSTGAKAYGESWKAAHYGRFLGISEEYERLTAADPGESRLWDRSAQEGAGRGRQGELLRLGGEHCQQGGPDCGVPAAAVRQGITVGAEAS